MNPWLIFGALAVFYAVGLAGHVLPAFLPLMLGLTPWFLLGAGAAAGAASLGGADRRQLVLWFVPTLVATFLLEALGVATGAVFGGYHYTDTLGSRLWGVPPVIGWNWVLVVLGVHSAVGRWGRRLPEAVRIGLTGLGCVLFDVLLEPVAISLGYWVWDGGTPPLQNYAAWGLIAAAGSWWAGRFPKLAVHPILGAYCLLQAVFFAALTLAGVRA